MSGGEAYLARRRVRAAALLHDIGHAPFSHSAEGRFEGGIDHEEMTRRLLGSPELGALFARYGEGVSVEEVIDLLSGKVPPERRFLAQIVSGELDVDKMDYLLRDSLYCGVRYGVYDLDRLVETLTAIADPDDRRHRPRHRGGGRARGRGADPGALLHVHAGLLQRHRQGARAPLHRVAARLRAATGRPTPSTSSPKTTIRFSPRCAPTATPHPMERFHARAVVDRRHYPLAYETREHPTARQIELLRTGASRSSKPASATARSSSPAPRRTPTASARARVLVRARRPATRTAREGEPVPPPPGAHRPLPRLRPHRDPRRSRRASARARARLIARDPQVPGQFSARRGGGRRGRRRGRGSGSRSRRRGGRRGTTRWPARSDCAISPSSSRSARPGAAGERGAGASRQGARELAVGDGFWSREVESAGGSSSRSRKPIAATSSARWIQGNYCRPVPSAAPSPKRNGGAIFGSAPPSRARTIPVRSSTRRTPSASTGCEARLPLDAQLGEEAAAGRGALVERLRAAVAVEADRRGLEENRRLPLRAGDRRDHDRPRRLDPARDQRALARRRSSGRRRRSRRRD